MVMSLQSMRWCDLYEDSIRKIVVTLVQRFNVYKSAFTNISFERHCDRQGALEADRSGDLLELPKPWAGPCDMPLGRS